MKVTVTIHQLIEVLPPMALYLGCMGPRLLHREFRCYAWPLIFDGFLTNSRAFVAIHRVDRIASAPHPKAVIKLFSPFTVKEGVSYGVTDITRDKFCPVS